ncbi:MAG: agglutinin biogenesis protein MshI [Proteobacteria bacterium]|nr:agglutinin biogenesis protein MshI [Burkholderiales bacterium]
MLFKAKQKPGWLSLAVTRDTVDIAHVSRVADGKPRLTRCETYRREGSLLQTMTRLRKELALDQFRLNALMPGGQYQFLQLEAPAVAAAELATALRWRIKDLIDFPVESAVVQTMTIPVDQAPGARTPQVFAVVARAEAVRLHAEPLSQSGLTLSAIDVAENAQRNISVLFEPPGRGIALAAFDETGGLLTVTFGGELYLARRIDTSLAALVDASEDDRRAAYDRITLELQRSIDHFDRQFGFVTLAKLLLAGVGPVDGLRDCLAENLSLPVELLDLAQVLDFPSVPELRTPGRQAQCLAGIGAALRDEASGVRV